MQRVRPSLTWTLLVFGMFVAGAAVRAEAPTIVTFEGVRPGTLPSGFRTLTSSETESGRWEVVRVGDRHVLGQTQLGHAGYRLAVLDRTRLEDLRLGTRLRFARGDRAAGLAWRVQDARNYYAARLDLDSHEFIVYKFVRGNRVRLSRVRQLRLDAADWHEIAVEHISHRIRVWLNGIPVAFERDDALPEPGMVGLWMPGDSTAHYAKIWYERASKD